MKTAMIWGASGGIGRALTQKLVDAGWQVVAITRYPEQVEDVAMTTIELGNVGSSADIDTAIYTAHFEADAISGKQYFSSTNPGTMLNSSNIVLGCPCKSTKIT